MSASESKTLEPGTTAVNARESFLRRYIVTPLAGQLRQGVTPEKMAQSLTWGAMIGVFPILGTTTVLCGAAALRLRLNHIAIQLTNWLMYPVQILLIIPFLHMGNMLFGIDSSTLSLAEITAAFESDWLAATRDLGWLAVRGIIAWCVAAIPVILLAPRLLTPLLRRLAALTIHTSNHTDTHS